MAIWECGTCNANFGTYQDLETHTHDTHGTRSREDVRFPASAKEKPLGPGEASHAQDLRTGRAGGMNERKPRAPPHPTGLKGQPPPREEKHGRR